MVRFHVVRTPPSVQAEAAEKREWAPGGALFAS